MGVEYLGLGCGLILMILMRTVSGRWLADTGARLVSIMLIFTVVSLLAIDPWLDRLRLAKGGDSAAFAWAHTTATAVYLLLCLLAVWLVLSDQAKPVTAK